MSMRRNTIKMKALKIRVADYYRRKEKQDAKWVKKRM
jgi:ribosomal protein S15P/S13E